MQSQQARLRTIAITGSNKGIGYAIAKLLFTGETPYNIIITSRDPNAGQKALKSISEQNKSSPSKLLYHSLNIDDEQSVDQFVNWCKTNYEKLDVLVNNAAIGYYASSVEERLETIQTNFLSTVRLTEKFLPSLSEDGKVLMISSGAGELSDQGKAVRKVLENENLTETELFKLTDQLCEATKKLKHKEIGFSDSAYSATKALLNAYTRWVLPRKLKGDQQCYSICPGWCRTDMGGQSAPLSAEEGADTPVYLINLPFKLNKDLTGKFFRKRKVISF